MPGMGSSTDPTPAVKGFAKRQDITFIHTEASGQPVAGMVTRMMVPIGPSMHQGRSNEREDSAKGRSDPASDSYSRLG